VDTLRAEFGDLTARRETLQAELDDVTRRIDEVSRLIEVAPRRGRGVRIPLEQARDAACDMRQFTIPQLADRLRASHSAAARLVDQLVIRQIIKEDGLFQPQRGRPAKLFVYMNLPGLQAGVSVTL
jgi:response regulator of citrate/malate metabolism